MSRRSHKLTDNQGRALNPEASVWVSASAGTGKTHVLTARVLKLMVRGTDPANILCITFTKAAAAEMAERVFRELGDWVQMDDIELSSELNNRVGEEADVEMLQRARALFAEVLDLPGGLRIVTIHSFCQSLLGRFPLEAELSPHFQVMDERTAGEFIKGATEGLLIEARTKTSAIGERLAAALAHLAARITEHTYEELMTAVSFNRGQLSALFNKHRNLDGVIAATREALGVGAKETKEEAHAVAVKDSAFDADGVRLLADSMAAGSAAEAKKADALYRYLEAGPEARLAGLNEYILLFLKKADMKGRASIANKGTLEAEPRLEAIIAQEIERLEALAERLALLEAAANTDALLTLASSFLEHYRAAKITHGLLDYDDLILKVDGLLAKDGIAPWIMYKLDGRIDHILIDEAQDTNPEQWRLVEALSDEFFVGSGARETVRTVFAVGDAKQSIFSFQRADPAEFDKAKKRTKVRSEGADSAFDEVSLSLSFRSTRTVLEVVDRVFASDKARFQLTQDDEEIRHSEKRLGQSGLVELWTPEPALEASEDAGEGDGEDEPWQPPVRQERSVSAEARLAARIAGRIGEMLDSNEELKARGRPIEPGDIMILVRRRNDFTEHMLRELKARDIAVAGADRMVLTQALAVRDLVALARFLLLPRDNLTLATVLKGPFIGIIGGVDEETLFRLAYDRGDATLWQRLKNNDQLRDAHAFLVDLLARVDFEAPYEFFANLLGPGGGRKKLTARLGHEINDPVDEFLALALSFERSHTPSLEGFLSWLEAGDATIKRDMEQGRNEVRIMTIHGAKGLQAPVVFLPDTCQVPKSQETLLKLPPAQKGRVAPIAPPIVSPIVWPGGKDNEAGAIKDVRDSNKLAQDAEYRRLLYVAMTRAEDRLYVGGWETKNKRPEACWYNLIADAFDDMAEDENGPELIEDADGGSVLRIESPVETVVSDKEKRSDAVTGPTPDLPAWIMNPAPDEPSPPQPLAPSRPDADGEAVIGPLGRQTFTGARAAGLNRGNLVHKLLELLPETAEELRQPAAMRYLEASAPDLTAAETTDIWQSVRKVLEDDTFAPLFGPGSRAEAAIAGCVGDRVISGQIDRLVVTDDAVLIVDYKTNRPPPASPAEVSPVYLKQMAAYQAAIKAIYPEHTVRVALLWTEETRMMALDDNILEPWRP